MTSLSFAMRVSTPAQVVTRPLDGELVLLNLGTETYFGLDEVGARMWDVLSSSPSIEAAFEQLASEYDIDAPTLRKDLEALLGQLVDHGLAELHDA